MTSIEKRFWGKVGPITEAGCWEWKASKDRKGYGRFFNKKCVSATRFSYELYRGHIPVGAVTDHLCRNRSCVNPDHIDIVDNKTNVLRGNGLTAINSRKTHCQNGHLFDEDNTYFIKGTNYRRCRKCVAEKARQFYSSKKEAQ